MKPIYTADGFFRYRTKLLSYELAQSFAVCIRANTTRFRDVEMHHKPAAKGAKAWFVSFAPVNKDRMFDIAEREDAARIQRADREGENYVYLLDVDSPRPFYRVFNPLSGETYELDSSTCDCPDFVYRCRRAGGYGIRCKHQHEMQRRFDAGELIRLADAYDTEEWRRAHPKLYGIREYHPAEVAKMAGGA